MTSPNFSFDGAGGWLRRPGLSRRIAVAMVLSLVAIQVQALLQFSLLTDPEIRLVGTRWLAEATRDAVNETFALPADRRSLVLGQKADSNLIRFSWGASPPWPDESGSPLAARLAATLREMLQDKVQAIRISVTTSNFISPVGRARVVVIPNDEGARLGTSPVRADEPDILISASARIAVQGADGTWVSVQPIAFRDGAFGASLPFAPLIAGGMIIALVSTFMARRLVAPLDRLVVAAERIGAAREPVHVETAGLHEFSAVAEAFEDMQQRLLRFVDDRTHMLAAISHDLRSSLTRLRLAAEQCPGEVERAALSAEIDEMRVMVDSTLAFASGEARLAPNKPTDIAALLISLVDEATDAGRPCSYEGPNHIETMGHPVSLKRAFWNIIDNALKYGKTANVELRVKTSTVEIIVDDEGPGIPEASVEDVFAPFRRLDPARGQETPGVGLGLTIARDVIQSHGGTIALVNRSGRGLSVVLELPRR